MRVPNSRFAPVRGISRSLPAVRPSPVIAILQSAGCAAAHKYEQRLSRWLLITVDRTHLDTFKMSQKFLSHLLGEHALYSIHVGCQTQAIRALIQKSNIKKGYFVLKLDPNGLRLRSEAQ